MDAAFDFLQPGDTFVVPAAPLEPVRRPEWTTHGSSDRMAGAPAGWDAHLGFRACFPDTGARARVAERHGFGAPDQPPNRLILADNLLPLRALPAASIDLC